MPWPTDPVRREAALVKFRAAQRARWTVEARKEAAVRATEQWKDAARRQRMSDVKRRQYVEDPDIARRISNSLRGKSSPATPARVAGLLAAARRKRERYKRLALIRNRAVLVSVNGKTAQATTSANRSY